MIQTIDNVIIALTFLCWAGCSIDRINTVTLPSGRSLSRLVDFSSVTADQKPF